MKKTTIKLTGILLGIYLCISGVSYLAFSYFYKKTPNVAQNIDSGRKKIDTTAPKTEECPLNGQKYTKAEREIWEKRRPLTVMIENHDEARPQSGLTSADVIYEAVAEGGITRFMAVYYCGAAADEVIIGPVRSARTYFLDWASEYGDYPLYAHVGGANKPGPADALGQIIKYGWNLYNDLNQFSVQQPPLTFKRDYDRLPDRATEHTMYSTTDKLWKAAEFRGLTNVDKKGKEWNANWKSWKFIDGAASPQPTASKISFPFWGEYDDYIVTWNYDPLTNTYLRDNGGKSHTDLNTEKQLSVSNVVVMFTSLTGPIDELKHILYKTTGNGKALYFQNGNVLEGTWSKASRESRTKFLDKAGKEISLVRGPIWIEVQDLKTDVTY